MQHRFVCRHQQGTFRISLTLMRGANLLELHRDHGDCLVVKGSQMLLAHGPSTRRQRGSYQRAGVRTKARTVVQRRRGGAGWDGERKVRRLRKAGEKRRSIDSEATATALRTSWNPDGG